MSRWLIAMEGPMQVPTTGENEVKTIEQNEKDISGHPTEGKGVQLNHQGFEGDGNNPEGERNSISVGTLKDGQGHTAYNETV